MTSWICCIVAHCSYLHRKKYLVCSVLCLTESSLWSCERSVQHSGPPIPDTRIKKSVSVSQKSLYRYQLVIWKQRKKGDVDIYLLVNTHMHVWTYASMHICTCMQVCEFASMQVCKYSSMQVFQYVKIYKFARVQVYSSMQVVKYEIRQVCKYMSEQVCKYMDVCKYASM